MRSSQQQLIVIVPVVCLIVFAAVCGCGGGGDGGGSSQKEDDSPQIITRLFPVRFESVGVRVPVSLSGSSWMDFAVARGPGAINGQGVIAGVRETSDGGNDAVLWGTEGVQVLDSGSLQPPSRLVVTDINDAGDVVGADAGSSDPMANGSLDAVLWRQGAMTRLEPLPGTHVSVAHGINRSGQVVGVAWTRRTMIQRAVLWQDGKATALAEADVSSEAIAINDNGAIIGSIGDRQVLWQNGTVKTLMVTASRLPGSPRTLFDINSEGTIVGEDDGDRSRRQTGGFVLSGIRPTPLPRLAGHDGIAPRAISDSGWIVGYAFNTEALLYAFRRTEKTAVLWRDGQVIDLNTLLPPGSSWYLSEATGINAAGAITGFGQYNGESHQFLLIVPPGR